MFGACRSCASVILLIYSGGTMAISAVIDRYVEISALAKPTPRIATALSTFFCCQCKS
jgi:hypothetical protein